MHETLGAFLLYRFARPLSRNDRKDETGRRLAAVENALFGDIGPGPCCARSSGAGI